MRKWNTISDPEAWWCNFLARFSIVDFCPWISSYQSNPKQRLERFLDFLGHCLKLGTFWLHHLLLLLCVLIGYFYKSHPRCAYINSLANNNHLWSTGYIASLNWSESNFGLKNKEIFIPQIFSASKINQAQAALTTTHASILTFSVDPILARPGKWILGIFQAIFQNNFDFFSRCDESISSGTTWSWHQ